MSEKIKEVKLSEFVENPDNPQTVTDRAFERLVGKLKRVPAGLTAKRIGYVTDHPAGKYVVLSGNKRLRALKVLRGTDGTAPAEWFQDITEMSEDQRREFIVAANICEGKWVAELLLAIVPKDELKDLMDWTGGIGVDAGATNRKLGSDMADSVTGGGLHGKDLSKADVSVNIYAWLKAQETGKPVELHCAIGDETVDGKPYAEIVEIARKFITDLGGFEKFAEWGLV